MKHVVILLSLLLIFGFTDPEISHYSKIYDQGLLVAEGWKNSEGEKEGYWKYYYSNGNIKSEGHYINDMAEKYWKFYYPNMNLSKEGHVNNNQETDWWVYYNYEGSKIEECEYFKGKKHGYNLFYKNGTLYKAKKFYHGKEVGEWTDYSSFVKDNS